MNKAVQLDPELQANHGGELAKRIAGWVDFAKIENPIEYLSDVYNNLPESLVGLQQRGDSEIAEKSIHIAFRAFENGDYQKTRSAIRNAITYKPGLLINRGVLSIYFKSLLNFKKGDKPSYVKFMNKRYFNFQVNRFVIMFVERAGSTYLTTLLNSHPDIQCVTEKLDTLKNEGNGVSAQLNWTKKYLTPPIIGKNRAIGFKTKQVDILDPTGVEKLLKQKKCRIIQLQRRNSVKAVISTINARRLWETSGNWNLLKEKDRQSAMEVNLDEFDNLLKLREKWDVDLENYINQINLPTLQLYYEDLLLNESLFIDKIIEFLEVDPKPVQGKTIKHTSDDLRDVILNFDELQSKYMNTCYESMFD